jgi:2',3'-cyclic-nucleotide 2'-phosphodiesterase (5'-nucleotidase family)
MMRALFFGALFTIAGCSSLSISVNGSNLEVSDNVASLDTLTVLPGLIDPYRDSMKREMGEEIAIAETSFTVNRKPSGNLSNWLADAVFVNQTRNKRLSDPVMCLLNTGGIRSAILKGGVTVGDMFKVMPFDNQVVWARLPIESLEEIHTYIIQKGGEPISNATVNSEDLLINGRIDSHTHFWVITSDYLANGGDNMNFFAKSTERFNTNILIRDILIKEARTQGTLHSDTTNRMIF